ncbi:hypothetical protein AGOR_G00201570 [Albula goreensis]|uniref:RNA-binding protein 20 n=1 Tax=Albula goreensis TaxID=1534307 RepID=A0A8T3CPG8_9TELE|nr:hypothetical protein AGOR_G00201570 [Albula goreensis]
MLGGELRLRKSSLATSAQERRAARGPGVDTVLLSVEITQPEATVDLPFSSTSSDHPEKKPLPITNQLSGGGQNPLVLTPASLQLAQLQAHLTLHRLKLAQTAVSGNTAAAATVLNQVLSNVAMSQPFFNQLRTPTMVSTPHGHAGGAQLGAGFPPSALAFPSQTSTLGSLVGAGFGCGAAPQNPHTSGIRPNCYGNNSPQPPGQQAVEYGKKPGTTFPSDTDRRVQFGFLGAVSKSSDGPRVPVPARADGGNHSGFQRDFFGSDSQGQSQPAAFAGEQSAVSFPSGGHKEQQWQSPTSVSHSGQLDMAPNTGAGWASGRQPAFHARGELYNPEEPTADPKFSHAGGVSFSSSNQGFEGYQQAQAGEESHSGGTLTLQPHQLNDFHAVTPAHLPHQCSICEKKVYNLKDWDQHVKGKLHLQNCTLYSEGTSAGSASFPASSEGCLKPSLNNSMAYSSTNNQDLSSGTSSTYLHTAPMMTHPSGMGFTLPPTGSKFPVRKNCPGRVVHICNLPEGSCTENDVINLGLPFGKVTNYILMRSTHQAFLEMAYVEAAQAMVQYYQLKPATINEQKLLIRMSKRYKELQLKKPGKDVESIIQDINLQRERHEKQEIDCYPLERARSRSPVSRSLSPRSHSPSFTSCSSAHSPAGTCRPDRSNGLGPRCPSWDWSSHMRREDERDESCWRNGDEDRPNGWLPEWRKAYFKPGDRASPRTAEERVEGLRGGRDRYSRSSPQGPPFPPYRGKDEDFYMKEPLYKSDKTPRPLYQRHEVRAKRRDTPEHHRSRHSDSEDPVATRTIEDRKQLSPARTRSKKTTRKQEVEKEEEETAERQSKEKSGSPPSSCENKEPTELKRSKDSEAEDWDSGEESEGEVWFPGNMEELVTVDEVGEEEEDSIIEPDLPTEQEDAPIGDKPEESSQTVVSQAPEKDGVQDKEMALAGSASVALTLQDKTNSMPCDDGPKKMAAGPASAERPSGYDLSTFPSPTFQAAFNEACACISSDAPLGQPPQEGLANHRDMCGGGKPSDILTVCETGKLSLIAEVDGNEAQNKDEHSGERKDAQSTSLRQSPRPLGVEGIAAHSPSWEQEKVFSEHSIPLGVEFVVPRSGFYCKLCGLFYTSEEKAKTTHCRSTVHYRNLQKYLSQLAAESACTQSAHTSPSCTE